MSAFEIQVGASQERRGRLRNRAIRGSAWTLGGFGISQVLRLGGNLLLTRLLFPEAFGMMMLVNIVMQGLQMFSDVGIGPSIIRHKNGDQAAFLNTAWTIQVIRGFLLCAAACGLAWPVAMFYDKPQLGPLIAVAALGAAIAGFNSTSLFTLGRRIALGRLTLLEVSARAIGTATMIAWALLWPSVWALVGGGLVSALAKMVMSHRVLPHRVHFAWDAEARAELFSFGRAVALSTAVTFLADQSERLILGKYIPLDVLGIYSVGFLLARFGTQILQRLMGKVLFPSISQVLRDDEGRAVAHYRRIRTCVDGIAVAGAVVLIPFGPWIIHHLYDSRYWDAGWMLQILAVQASFDIMRAPASWLLLAAGKPGYNVWAGLCRLVVLCVGLPMAFWLSGIHAAVWVVALSSAPSLIVFSYGIGRTFPALRVSEWRSGFIVTALVVGVYLAVN